MKRSEEREARNEERVARSEQQFTELTACAYSARRRRSSPRSSRRGVLLLVVLSMLVLFMLIGTAFLMSSSQEGKNSQNAAKLNRMGNPATKDLDSALMQVVRDSENEHSAIRYHSLLRDVYGTDGFQGSVYSPAANVTFNPAQPASQVTRFAGAAAGNTTFQLGPTQGQFIDLYVRVLGWNSATNTSLEDPLTTALETTLTVPDERHVVRIDRLLGRRQIYTLPLTKGYFNGCVLTITSGPAAGQSTRILDYEYLTPDIVAATATSSATRIFRIRVMAFPRIDGQPLQIATGVHNPELSDLAGATFIVNGRAFSGTGAGYNPLAATGQPRLNAQEMLLMGTSDLTTKKMLYAEVALTPNARYFFPSDLDPDPSHTDARGVRVPGNPSIPLSGGQPMNPKITSSMTATDIKTALSQWKYPAFGGLGDVNESYDAADFQNMFLALQTVTPRAQGRVVTDKGTFSIEEYLANPTGLGTFLRFDTDDVPIPSFHRPELVNYWNHRLLATLTAAPFSMSPDAAGLAILDPYPNGALRAGLDPSVAALITAVKRKVSLRPLRADHPHFDGGNLMSVPGNLPTTVVSSSGSSFTCPCTCTMGPWDVDNDNDGVPDSIWVDLGDPVQQAEDGTLYKPLYAMLIIDLDSRLNVNAHGLADDIVPPLEDPTRSVFFDPTNRRIGNLAHNPAVASSIRSTLQLPRGLGYGPAEISLRPVFPVPTGIDPDLLGNRVEALGLIDDYSAILFGRQRLDNTTVSGKYGFGTVKSPTDATQNYPYNPRGDASTAGMNYRFQPNAAMITGEAAVPSLLAQLKFFEYPWADNRHSIFTTTPNQLSAFGTSPDLRGRYALGLDYVGQPVYEVTHDVNPNTAAAQPNKRLPFNLLAKSPYELDLSGSQRRDGWAASINSSIGSTAAAFTQSLVQNDDAAFSPTDLEKVLRAWDADSGTLPSRLWDSANAFDPTKLLNTKYGDPLRVQNAAVSTLGAAGATDLLTAAQQIATINRRLVTTDSFDLPVAGGNLLSRMIYGADGQPGKANVDDDANGKVDDPSEIGWGGSDDYNAVMKGITTVGAPTGLLLTPARGTVVELLKYRVQLERLKRGLTIYTESQLVNVATQLLPPEVIAGEKMDVNRPFGDGRDNNGDGVVDDPLEAGEPYLDVDGNGKYGPSEPFLDLNGNGEYDGPQDVLWQGLTAEPITFDYTNGVSVPLYYKLFNGGVRGGVRNLESQGRQQYARQLYCLMLLLVDENYIAPWDENDPQVMTWMEKERKKLTSATPPVSAANADLIVKRKNTCRMIAQWAINCVDMRDSDVIMTPFEYDENPWDGWGTMDAKGNLIPLDGDVATDENKGEIIDWTKVTTRAKGGKKQLTTIADVPTPVDQTRGVVWGAERPELLITETIAMHDRRTEDVSVPNGHEEMQHYQNPAPGHYADADPDQGLRPRGSLFVEVKNPWSADGQLPNELYSRLDQGTNYTWSIPAPDPTTGASRQGVELGRLSNYAVDANGNLTLAPSNASAGVKRSPVWRLAVVEEWPGYRNADEIDGKRLDRELMGTMPAAYGTMTTRIQGWTPTVAAPNPPFKPTDPDFDEAFDPTFLPKQKGIGDNVFEITYPYIEREFYFTTDKSPKMRVINDYEEVEDYNYNDDSFKLRIPYRAVKIQYPTEYSQPRVGQTQKFPPVDLEASATGIDSPIAPILPGRFGVIGSAGTDYKTDPLQTDPKVHIYTTTIGREGDPDVASSWSTDDASHKSHLSETRRIELRPNNDPNVQQILVGSNGGDPRDDYNPTLANAAATYDVTSPELGRDNEIINDRGKPKNIYSSKTGNDGTLEKSPNDRFYLPCVTIPVEGMNISEPAWGYAARELEAAKLEAAKKGGQVGFYKFKIDASHPEGRYFTGDNAETHYDKPFDGWNSTEDPGQAGNSGDDIWKFQVSPELMRIGTTPNYRTIHLQRLANPMLPWNPPPGQFKDAAGNDLHRPNVPINPYRTIDTSSVNLTAFNGVDGQAEAQDPTSKEVPKKLMQKRPWTTPSEELEYVAEFQNDRQVWCFRSTERGAWARLNQANINEVRNNGAQLAPPSQRLLWAQEPAMVRFKYSHGFELFDLIPQRQMTMRAKEVPGEYAKFGNKTEIKGDQAITANRMNMVMEHTLGFGNESWGLLYDKQGAKQPGTPVGSTNNSTSPTAAAVGAPAAGRIFWDGTTDANQKTSNSWAPVDSTNPWLAWGNRPFVSAEELLNVPAASQAMMLRMYSTIEPNKPAGSTANPYGLAQLGVAGPVGPTLNAARLAVMQAPFGQLMNVFAASSAPAGYVSGTNVTPYGAPNFYRLLDYVQVPSRFVGTETMLNAEMFNDVPSYVSATEPIGTDITGPSDPRYNFQPPFNKISRERDPGKVNLNTVTGRRSVVNGIPQIWSEVYDGIMHRTRDGNPASGQLGQPGPAWRDVVLSRKGYAQYNVGSTTPLEKSGAAPPDVAEFGLNPLFPTVFANPFRSSDAGDLVPLPQMMQFGVDASLLRKHPYDRAKVNGVWKPWGPLPAVFGDARDAGFGNSPNPNENESVSVRASNGAIPDDDPSKRDILPLFSEKRDSTFADTDRNPYMMYQPMTRLGNLVTDRSGVFAVWITVGYFEVEPAPNWNDPVDVNRRAIRLRFGASANGTEWDDSSNSATIAALALYNRVYPDGYMLGRELGSDTGNIKRPRGFYIIDRTEAVGFKPGEDLNVEKMIRLRRRIE